MKQKNLKTYVFIDATNIIYGAKRNSWRMDFSKLAKYLRDRYCAEHIFYYAGMDSENKKQLNFYEKLKDFDYTLRLVPVKKFSDGKKKADVDSRMTFELMKYINEYDTTIIFSGDGDYYWVLEYLIDQKKTAYLFGFRNSTARELRKLFKERFTDLSDLRHIVSIKKR